MCQLIKEIQFHKQTSKNQISISQCIEFYCLYEQFRNKDSLSQSGVRKVCLMSQIDSPGLKNERQQVILQRQHVLNKEIKQKMLPQASSMVDSFLLMSQYYTLFLCKIPHCSCLCHVTHPVVKDAINRTLILVTTSDIFEIC